MTLGTLNYGNYGIFLIMGIIMGNAGFCPSTVSPTKRDGTFLTEFRRETAVEASPPGECGLRAYGLRPII